jgi:two-component system, chemotaxis family, sensor kinase CheA
LEFQDLESLFSKMESIPRAAQNKLDFEQETGAEILFSLIKTLQETTRNISISGDGSIPGLSMFLEILESFTAKFPPAYQTPIGQVLVSKGVVTEEEVDNALELQKKPLGELLVESGSATKEQIQDALKTQNKNITSNQKLPKAKLKSKQDIRVDLEKLDILINLIGEIVIAENMLVNNPDLKDLELENFTKAGQHMQKIVRELQEMAMLIRMIPIAALFRRMKRLVHDLSRKSGKKADFIISGETTEIDKTVIEMITDPLVHIIRNSMDHGIEPSEERVQTDKGETGTIKLSASHEEGDVLIIVEDDGKGLSKEKLLKKAIEKKLIQGDGSDLKDSEIFNLIFEPGFSTADKVTDISGRGVGMDVVRRNLEKIKGKIEVKSIPGKGTKMVLRIPLTLAIIEGMLIRVGKSFYILPILAIRESFQPKPDAVTITPDGQELVKVRDNLLPVIRLHKLHNITPDQQKLAQGILIVLENQDQKVCLFADELMGQQQTVIKALSDYIEKTGDVGGVSGCTILGNGEVCLILDVRSLSEFVGA